MVESGESSKDGEVTVDVEPKPQKKGAQRKLSNLIRRLRKLRNAKTYYSAKDVETMKAEHARLEHQHTNENCIVNYIQSLVFGGVDGIITSFAVVAAIAGAGYSTFYVVVIGVANLVADGISMGLGDYLSSSGEIEFAKQELEREMWEYDNYQDGEEAEMVEIFQARGMTYEDAVTVVSTTAKYKEVFCNEMMIHELSLMPPEDEESPVKKGLMTFIAFIICGIVPLLVYLASEMHQNSDVTFAISCAMTAGTLFLLGALKSLTSYVSWFSSGLSIMVCGCVAAAAAFGISAFAGWAVGDLGGCTNSTILTNLTHNATSGL